MNNSKDETVKQEQDPLESLVFDKGLYSFVKSLQEQTSMDDDEAGAVYHILKMWDQKEYVPQSNYELPKSFNE